MRKEFNNYDFGPIYPIGESPYEAPPAFPRAGEHPRLMFTKDMIPKIREALDDPAYASVRAKLDQLASDPADGMLGIPAWNPSRKGIHNYRSHDLNVIEAKAFLSAVTGNKELGYEAIDAMQNYLLTLNIRYIFCDMCREYGMVMSTAARVYDWCYNIMTEDEKYRLFAGILNYTAAGTCGMKNYNFEGDFRRYCSDDKMEVGFPPTGQGCVTGHGSEGQITRDYLSVAIAAYDEHPDWWELVAGRYFHGYVKFRNYYYKSGAAHQGPSYGAARQAVDLWAAFTIKTLFGENPLIDETPDTIKAYWHHELPNGSFFNDGDNWEKDMSGVAKGALTNCSLLASVLYGDRSLMAQYVRSKPELIPNGGWAGDSVSEFFILLSTLDGGIVPADRHEGYSPVLYNGSPVHKMIARGAWDDPDAPAVYMKAGERTTANHEHKDMGTFQIFYKGLLTRDSGVYDSYGSPYSTGTIAHNGVTVFNPQKAEGWYSGSQRGMREAPTLEAWLENECYHTGDPEGAAYALKADGKHADFAYIASNIAPAYDEDVEYLSRRMLSVFTDSKEFPLIFATYDRITAADASFRKAVLLHADNEPTVEGNRVTLVNGDGKLVASYFSDGDFSIEKLGGINQNRMINGKQCGISTVLRGDDWTALWGRVEVVPRAGSKTDDVLAVMYVTDKDNENALSVTKLSGEGVIGALAADRAMLFVKDMDGSASLSIDVDAAGEITYYISGLSVGEWSASVGGRSIKLSVSEAKRFASFTAPAGKLALTKI